MTTASEIDREGKYPWDVREWLRAGTDTRRLDDRLSRHPPEVQDVVRARPQATAEQMLDQRPSPGLAGRRVHDPAPAPHSHAREIRFDFRDRLDRPSGADRGTDRTRVESCSNSLGPTEDHLLDVRVQEDRRQRL